MTGKREDLLAISGLPSDIRKLRAAYRNLLPPQAFEPQRKLLAAYAAAWVVNALLICLIIHSSQLWLQLLLAIALGFTWTSTLLFVHELIHGHIFRSVFWQRVFALPCAYFILQSPTFFSYSHRLHHRFGTLDRYVSGFHVVGWVRSSWIRKILESVEPDQAKSLNFIHLTFWKPLALTFNQVFFFFNPRFRGKVNYTAVFSELALLLAAHGIVWYVLDWRSLLFVEVIPWFVQNVFSSTLVITNHHPRLLAHGNALANTCSIHFGNRLLNQAFLNVGYHTEHHVFPECNVGHISLLRAGLARDYPGKYCWLSWVEAMRIIFVD